VLESNSFNEKVTFNLPAGFVVDETPDSVKLDTPFGKYSVSYEVKDGKLLFSRSLTMTRGTVSVERYTEVRNFFSKIRDAEQAPVVLVRK
jgi:proline racemase